MTTKTRTYTHIYTYCNKHRYNNDFKRFRNPGRKYLPIFLSKTDISHALAMESGEKNIVCYSLLQSPQICMYILQFPSCEDYRPREQRTNEFQILSSHNLGWSFFIHWTDSIKASKYTRVKIKSYLYFFRAIRTGHLEVRVQAAIIAIILRI